MVLMTPREIHTARNVLQPAKVAMVEELEIALLVQQELPMMEQSVPLVTLPVANVPARLLLSAPLVLKAAIFIGTVRANHHVLRP